MHREYGVQLILPINTKGMLFSDNNWNRSLKRVESSNLEKNTMQTTFVLEKDFGAQGSNTQRIYASPNYVSSAGLLVNGTFDIVELYDATQIFEVRTLLHVR